MRMQNYPEEKFKKEILKVIGKHLDLSKHKVFIFGSRVSGKGDERSDIDVGIEGKIKIPFSVMGKIRDEIEAVPVLYEVEIVDFKKVDSNFKKVALKNIEKLN